MSNRQGRRPTTAPPVHGSSEYSQSYATTARPRPRNPLPGWTTRNRSEVLPAHPELHHINSNSTQRQPRRPQQRWPWQERAARSEIFENPRVPDVNNNPTIPLRPRAQVPQRWPWQRRAQSSAVFLFGRTDQEQGGPGTMAPPTQPPRNQPKWPWQERAAQSKVFEGVEEKVHTHKTYEWDQRKSPFFTQEEPQPSKSQPQPKKGPKAWPWQQKAQESSVFSTPDPKEQPGIKYPWDQRQSAFDVKLDPNAKFESVSRYTHDFINNKVDTRTIEPAGKRCYGTMDYRKSTVPPSTETLGHLGRPEPIEFSKSKEDLAGDQTDPEIQINTKESTVEGNVDKSRGDEPINSKSLEATTSAAAGKRCYVTDDLQKTSTFKSTVSKSNETLKTENKKPSSLHLPSQHEWPEINDLTAETENISTSKDRLPLTSSKVFRDRTNEISTDMENIQITPVKEEPPLTITKVITPNIRTRKDPRNPNVIILDLTEK